MHESERDDEMHKERILLGEFGKDLAVYFLAVDRADRVDCAVTEAAEGLVVVDIELGFFGGVGRGGFGGGDEVEDSLVIGGVDGDVDAECALEGGLKVSLAVVYRCWSVSFECAIVAPLSSSNAKATVSYSLCLYPSFFRANDVQCALTATRHSKPETSFASGLSFVALPSCQLPLDSFKPDGSP